MTTKIKKNLFYFFFVATSIFYIGDCLSDAAIDVSGTQQCYNIGGHEVCYFIGFEHLSDWQLAYEICEGKDSTLPIIRNEDEQNALEKYLKYLQLTRPSVSFVWTAGKKRDFNDWIWINGQPVSDTVRQSMLTGDSDDTHVMINQDYSIGAKDPEYVSPFLCQFYGERCAVNGRIKRTDSCAVISSFMATWFNARSDCLARGGDLAVLNDRDLQILKNNSPQLAVSSVWIGLRRMSWFWQLDSKGKQTEEIKYAKWRRNVLATSGNTCIQVEAFTGFWIDTECGKKHSIICQTKDARSTRNATIGDANAGNQSTEPQSGSIGVLTFALSIAGVVLVCIAIVGIIAARKALATRNSGRNFRRSTSSVFSHDYCALQPQSESAHEDLIESKY